MTIHDAEWAFGQYEAVRDVLPKASYPAQSETVSCLGDLAGDFDVFLLDAFGVLNVGETAIASAIPQVAALQDTGKRVMVITNGATMQVEAALAKYSKLGFDFAAKDVVASRDALAVELAQHHAVTWGVMAGQGTTFEDLPVKTVLLGDDPADYDRVQGFLALSTVNWPAHRQAMLLAALKSDPRPLLVGNPDIVAPREAGLTLEPGHFAHLMAAETGVVPMFFGKPFGNVFDLAFSRLDRPDKSRVLMVGDTLHTDILGGAAYGVKTALITDHGLFAGLDVAGYMARSGIRPDFTMGSP